MVQIFGNVIAMGGQKKGDIKILGLKKISQYMAKQSCKKHDPGAWIKEPAILLSSKYVFLKEPHPVVFQQYCVSRNAGHRDSQYTIVMRIK